MANPTPPAHPPRAAGGALIALCVMVGSIVGLAIHQPTICFLIGLAIGVAAAIVIWLIDRRR